MIEVRNLYHSYTRDNNYAVKDVSFTVDRGEILGLLGPNGAGKSTTQKVMIGLLPLQKGKVTLDGVDVRQGRKDLYEKIGISFEQPNLYKKLTGYENLKMYSRLFSGETAGPEELLKLVDLWGARDKRAEGYSKGMQQRLVFARSLVNRPRIWFLDEPTAGLDPNNARQVKDIILEKKQAGASIILSTHNMAIAEELCDRVALINSGEIVALDTPRNLKLQFGQRLVRVEYRRDGALVQDILALETEADKARLAHLLAEEDVETVHSQEATLETVFIKLTGRRLSEHVA
jgi:fluoroquinolone transport system ATP-binding protein